MKVQRTADYSYDGNSQRRYFLAPASFLSENFFLFQYKLNSIQQLCLSQFNLSFFKF